MNILETHLQATDVGNWIDKLWRSKICVSDV